jgi:hypothetical protein
MAMKPSGQAYCTVCKYHRVSSSLPRSQRNAPTQPMAIMMTPMPTIRRNAMNTGKIGGRSSGLNSFRPGKVPSSLWVRMKLARLGIAISKSLRSSWELGIAKRTSSPGREPSQWLSIAATLAG